MDGHLSTHEEQDEEVEEEEKVLNLAKEDSEEKTGEEVGIQAAMQMSLNQVTKENPNNCKTDFSQLMAAQAPGLWQSQLANAAARIEPPSPPAQVGRADGGDRGGGGLAAYSDHEEGCKLCLL